jgi:hypothetical protein
MTPRPADYAAAWLSLWPGRVWRAAWAFLAALCGADVRWRWDPRTGETRGGGWTWRRVAFRARLWARRRV